MKHLCIKSKLFLGFLPRAQAIFQPTRVCVLSIFSLLFSASVIMGAHIKINGAIDSSYTLNYISSYSWIDILAFVALAIAVDFVLLIITSLILDRRIGNTPYNSQTNKLAANVHKIYLGPISFKNIILSTLFLFVLWIPYFLSYFPGIIFGDTVASIGQSLANHTLDNHQPALYSLFLQLLIKIGKSIGIGATGGCALYSIFQMIMLASCISFAIEWICVRTKLHFAWRIISLAIFGIFSYFATFSIAMWKDPIFSCAFTVLTIFTLDLFWHRQQKRHLKKRWYFVLAISCLLLLFLRNNGIFILVCLLIAFIFIYIFSKKKFRCRELGFSVCIILGACLFYAFTTGPIYSALDIKESPKEESLGICLNQMAAVAARNGELSSEDQRFLDSMLPLEKYKDVYAPCIVDRLKWDKDFNSNALNDNFFSHWFSIGVKNPAIYLEAWELQTFGFWAVNVPFSNTFQSNIGIGAVWNCQNDLVQELKDTYNIHTKNIFCNDSVRNFFSLNTWFIPISWITWVLIYLAILCFLAQKRILVVALVPAFVLIATLLLASPIACWPRYAAALQLSLPIYIMLFATISRE